MRRVCYRERMTNSASERIGVNLRDPDLGIYKAVNEAIVNGERVHLRAPAVSDDLKRASDGLKNAAIRYAESRGFASYNALVDAACVFAVRYYREDARH